jgi:TrmH family RNA methyltransferase
MQASSPAWKEGEAKGRLLGRRALMARPAACGVPWVANDSAAQGATMTADRITSRRNARVVDARKLDQRKHRRRQGRFRVEGLQLLHMAVEAGAQPREVFVSEAAREEDAVALVVARLEAAGGEILPVTAHVMGALAERDEPQGVVATFDLCLTDAAEVDWGAPDDAPALVLLLDRLQDPGNLGTLVRTADAVGAKAVILAEPCADPFDLKAVRGSMGSLFNLPLVSVDDSQALAGRLVSAGFRLVGAEAHGGERWGDAALAGRVALVLGNEARGVSADLAAMVDARVTLPVPGRAESLNVAVAGAVLMYAWLRQAEGGG